MLRSYSKALDVLRPVKEATADIRGLIRKVAAQVEEYEEGKYDMEHIRTDAVANRRRPHADFCSPLIIVDKREGSM